MLTALIIIFVFSLCLVCIYLMYILKEERGRYKRLERSNEGTLDTLARVFEGRDKYKSDLTKERGRNKSVEVRTGFILEKAAPFMEAFGENPQNAHHMGSPIDYIVFNEDSIIFVEVKTGKARLTKKQNNIKRLVEEGKVGFKTVRFDYE